MQKYDMSAILGVKPLNQDQIDKLNRRIVAKAKTLCELLADLHGVSLGDGLSISVLRNPDINTLLSVHITPVDSDGKGGGVLRYDAMSKALEA